MAKKADGPFVAVAVEIPENAPTDCVPGVMGVLEVWESERKWPGKKGAFFCYPLTVELETDRYFKTSFSYDLTMSDGIASFEKEGRCYRFEIVEPVSSMGNRIYWGWFKAVTWCSTKQLLL